MRKSKKFKWSARVGALLFCITFILLYDDMNYVCGKANLMQARYNIEKGFAKYSDFQLIEKSQDLRNFAIFAGLVVGGAAFIFLYGIFVCDEVAERIQKRSKGKSRWHDS